MRPHHFLGSRVRLTSLTIAGSALLALSGVASPVYASDAPDVLTHEGSQPPSRLPETVAGHALVRFLPGVESPQQTRTLAEAGVTVDHPMGLSNAYDVQFPENRDPQDVARQLSAQPGVKWAEPDYYGETIGWPQDYPTVTPLDSKFPSQWALNSAGGINAQRAWGITDGDVDPLVAVIDTGFNLDHVDSWSSFRPNPVEGQPGKKDNGKDDDNNGYTDDWLGYDVGSGDNDASDKTGSGNSAHGHGTLVSGVIGARGNDKGVSGVARTVSMLPVKVSKDNGKFTSGRLADGLAYAHKMHAKVANVSLTVGVWTNAVSDALSDVDDMLVVAGAGNDDYDLDSIFREAYPCESNHDNVICVASQDSDGTWSSWSNQGSEVDLAAPGDDIWSTAVNGGYEKASGTSLSTPHVTAVAAMLFGMNGWIENQNAHVNVSTAKTILLESVKPEPTLKGRTATGGRLDAFAALRMLDIAQPGIITHDPDEVGKSWAVFSGQVKVRGVNITQVAYQYRLKGKPQTQKEFWFEITRDYYDTYDGQLTNTQVLDPGTYEYRYVARNPYGTNTGEWRTFSTPKPPKPPRGPGTFTNGPHPTH